MAHINAKSRIFIGLSGGVDSSVAALLLKEQGYRVEGVFMQNWREDGKTHGCPQDTDLHDAQAVCHALGIPLHTVSFAQTYWDRVFQQFLDDYAAGRTPNPDILCNKEIKFKAFLAYALAQGADHIATGHYAGIDVENGLYRLKKASDLNKDQSYFLYTLQQAQLAHSLFPLSELNKVQVRAIAKTHGLANHAKKDSTGICFIGERKFKDFLGEYLLARPGAIETTEGHVLGRHNGLMFYTLGQRQGLGIGGQKKFDNNAWYVIDKDIARQALVVGQSHDHPKLWSCRLFCDHMHWTMPHAPKMPLHCSAKTRYRQADAVCVVQRVSEQTCQVDFLEPQWAVTPGQSVVFYQKEVCLGGGVILRTDATSICHASVG